MRSENRGYTPREEGDKNKYSQEKSEESDFFSKLRELLSIPNKENWKKIEEILVNTPEGKEEVVADYIAQHIQKWPNEIFIASFHPLITMMTLDKKKYPAKETIISMIGDLRKEEAKRARDEVDADEEEFF